MDDSEAKRGPKTAKRLGFSARIALRTSVIISAILIGLFIVSFFIDGLLRSQLEARMNSSLKGYHVTLGHAHLQLLTLRLTLERLIVRQDAHPSPPVAEFPLIRFHIHWAELISGHVLAGVGVWNPRIHIDLPQLATEVRSKTPLRKHGWQDALESVYPFKINHLAVHGGDIIYIDTENSKPLHFADLNFISNNIRNISEPNNVYPSSFSGDMTIFGSGRLTVNGRANYLMKPYPGFVTDYVVSHVPLDAVTPATQHVNILITDGLLSSNGTIEYSPAVTNVEVRNATIESVNLSYLHLAQTQHMEKQRVIKAGEGIKKQNNRPAVNVDVQELDINHSRLNFENQKSDQRYALYIADTNIKIQNLSNHLRHGPSRLDLDGGFMGNGATRVSGTFLAGGAGPEFAVNIQIINTRLTTLNPLLRAYGRVDVAQGYFTMYSQIEVKNSRFNGYIKPMFSDIQVYGRDKDKNKNPLQKAKILLVGAAAHILKNRATQKVATQVNLAGELKNPQVSSWQAFVEVIRNAFIKAILPGFDRQVNQ
ncbi:MAG: DUF748 domain-containing protein [Deltaproteobacteria bacterium]|nr:DUF748 domain-containing protein [Deltaproteobacteria bacterium]